jgi:hypothetical protein
MIERVVTCFGRLIAVHFNPWQCIVPCCHAITLHGMDSVVGRDTIHRPGEGSIHEIACNCKDRDYTDKQIREPKLRKFYTSGILLG